ncbi:acetyl-coenzyme a carboxylase carboxyl transferase subunit alpha chloroplastic [Phtheirospermum japonicum]|uniref:Acetyl-coenzyme a carboxylase carboxyl transferase subunit alpha chloroplastic n=1 Tax=Phtheirospermum japonicum TaxID=374723 RepID=A0A830B0Z4_9LAMI|nr:acetyl-coenzyme a carboxylase carboxyl transferase subunit alpha chloroplastic [Phtheirospermum japonicum]
MADDTGLDFTDQINALELKYQQVSPQGSKHTHLSPIQRLSIARHPNRLTVLDHILNITEKSCFLGKWDELHGDRAGYDDPAIVSGNRSNSQQLVEIDSHVVSTPSTRSASKKLGSPFGCLSLRKFEAPEEETEHLKRPVNDPYQDIETAYVAQVCLTWEALHCQYKQLTQKISFQPDSHLGKTIALSSSRPEIYSRTRKSLPRRLLQIPKIQASDEKSIRGEEASDYVVLATDLIRVIESSIQTSLEKKAIKLKEVWKRSKSYKKKTWPSTGEDDVEMLLGLMDVKVLLRVLRMVRISTNQLFWCEEKMEKLGLSEGKLQRDPSPIPC